MADVKRPSQPLNFAELIRGSLIISDGVPGSQTEKISTLMLTYRIIA